MNIFISHNKKDLIDARALATAFIEYGINIWFDEWEIMPGDSIIGGIEEGLENANIFILVWSQNAKKSEWVGSEVKAYLHRKMKNPNIRIVPIMLDKTPLPSLIKDYRGFEISDGTKFADVAQKILGVKQVGLIRILQKRLAELVGPINMLNHHA